MSNLQLHYEPHELLADADVVEPHVVGGVVCHGGFDADGAYVPPRTLHRVPATRAWQQAHREAFGTEIVDVPLATWPEPYPNVAQAEHLLRAGVRDPIVTTLTRIGTVEGFGAMIRMVPTEDLQRHFVESIDGSCLAHLDRGMFEAQARDEAGWDEQAGHSHMWFAARDVAFEHPVTEDETQRMLDRMGIRAPGSSPAPASSPLAERHFDDVDPALEFLLRRMIGLLFIELSAFHIFAWAEDVLGDEELVAGEGEAGRLVSRIRADERPHVEYLKTAITEVRDRTIVGESGRRHSGTQVVGELWDLHLADSLGARREQTLRTTLREVELALEGHRRRGEILEDFHELGSVRPTADGSFVST